MGLCMGDRYSRSYAPVGLRVLRGPGEEYGEGSYWMVGDDYGYVEVHMMRGRDSYHPGSFYIEHIVVNDDHRGKGHGRRLYLLVEQMARNLGCKWIQVDSESQADGFWVEMGFSEIPKVYYKDKTAMVKRLEP